MAASDEIGTINSRLAEIKLQVAEAFPLSESGVQDLLADLHDRVLAIHQVEQKAVTELESLIGKTAEAPPFYSGPT